MSRKNTIRESRFILYFLMTFIIVNCKKDSDEPLNVILDQYLEIFIFHTQTGQNTYSDGVVKIVEGEKVTFENESDEVTSDTETLGTTRQSYSGNFLWEFEGGDPSTASDSPVEVTYNTPGKYKVTLKLDGNDVFEPIEKTLTDYVCVEPKSELICLIENEEVSDGRSTLFIYDENNILVRADKSLNGQLQEYSNYTYDELINLIREDFLDELGQQLGIRKLSYNDDNQLINEKTEAADGTLVRERTFTWDEQQDFIIGAVYEEPDGVGGLTTFDVTYTYDADRHNITGESFSQNGLNVGGNTYTFDTNEKVFTGLTANIMSSPLLFNAYNVTSITTVDQNGTVVSEQTSTFGYDPESCNRPVEEIRTINGSPVTFNFGYNSF